ncbi:iron complex outermembrane receptor protein [Sphingobium fontiphilum]|uniref:Iron complex outermembrane receptor protein n=1 Tax=Sphingobium fontiphilum TaxID=944425 RepID=A0A7W6GNF7_9SPHN|nr:TonB-dependent receptor [Sphingobium fontiphilum]MBB3981452.1 iron complex outermembrane receptor protein [Sphingobium fontiphilum]
MRLNAALLALAMGLAGASAFTATARTVPSSILSQRHKFEIGAQPLNTALNQLAAQAGVRILFPYDDVSRLRSPALRGWFTTQEALKRLLAGTGLALSETGHGVIALTRPGHSIANEREASRALAITDAPAVRRQRPPVAQAAIAEEAPAAALIVTGTRLSTRSLTGSLSPIDILLATDLAAGGRLSTRDLLGGLVPSLTVSNSGSGASFAIKTLSMRGLAGDHLLVLVNGKRRHNMATLFINGTTQSGQSPPDLDFIPAAAIRRIEVLRDGASAQYGSDALAGVINILLKDDAGGQARWTAGLTARGDGEEGRIEWSQGLAIGEEGHIHLTLDGHLQGHAFRSAANNGPFFETVAGLASTSERNLNRVVNRGGQPQLASLTIALDASAPLGDANEFYSFGTMSRRNADAWLTYRTPDALNNVPALYPLGYSPRLHINESDAQWVAGLRGEWRGWDYDLSTSFARNLARYGESSTLNASLGAASPSTMALGSAETREWIADLDLRRSVDGGLDDPMTIGIGVEYRGNRYSVGAGEPASWQDGGWVSADGVHAGVPRAPGAQGVSGFPASAAGRWSRHGWAAYASAEQAIGDSLELALAGRHEDYSDFGVANSGKASARVALAPGLALRGTISTGFRAPTLQQQHYASASTINVGGALLPVSALPARSAAAQALGAAPLRPERSTHWAAGLVASPGGGLNLTVDAYQIDIRDRILLSDVLTGPAVRAALDSAGLTGSAGAFYFSNAANTRTRGLDLVANWRSSPGPWGTAAITFSANINRTRFTHIDAAPAILSTTDPPGALIGRARQGDVSMGTPRDKLIANLLWSGEAASINLRATRYGRVTQVHPTDPALDAPVSPRIIVDLEGTLALAPGARISLGANNLFDTYPDKLPEALRANGFWLYNPYSPWGSSGGLYYARFNLEF